jgi:hypothetical protein
VAAVNTAALIEMLIEELGPPLAELVGAGISALAESIKAANMPVTAAGVVREIVEGVAASHPDWPGDAKRQVARDAVAQYLENHGTVVTDAAVNALLELAVQAVR